MSRASATFTVWRGSRIADFLNRNGRPAPCGGTWSPRQVESVYENECYTGLDVKGRFYRRDEELGYVDLERSENELATATYFRPIVLPRDKWMEDDQPHMKDFLPSHIRATAIREHQALWTRCLDPFKPERKYNPHPSAPHQDQPPRKPIDARSGMIHNQEDRLTPA